MTAALDYPPEFIPPAHLWVPPGRRGTYGPEVVDFAEEIGHPLDPEQAADLDALASYGPGGAYLTLETCYVEARQQGKTDRVGLPLAMADVWLFGADGLTWTAHRVETVLDVFGTVKRLIEANETLSRRVREIHEQRAEWAIELMSGALFEFRVRGGGGGRGIPRDIWVADEALYVDSGSMGDRLPTLSSRPNPQVRYLSSGCKAVSTQLRAVVRRGRAGGDPSLILVERCAPGSWDEPGCGLPDCDHTLGTPGCTLDREELYHLANHRVGRSPGPSYQFLRAERRALPPLEFGRERLGWHQSGPDDLRHPLLPDAWADTSVDESPVLVGEPAFFITIGPDGSAVIASAADQQVPEGVPPRPHVELADRRAGADWLAERLTELAKAWPGARFGAGARGPVAGMVETGLPVEVELLTAAELAQGCVRHEALTKARGYTHRKDPAVDLSFKGAVAKPAGDGLWAWDWRTSSNLAPMAAHTGALRLLEKHRDDDYDPLDSVW